MRRGISLTAHSAIEVIAAPLLMVAPFVFDFGTAAMLISVVLGVTLLTLAIQVDSPGRSVPISAHADFDYLLVIVAVIGGLAIGLATSEWYASIFLVGFGVAQALLTASTRFTLARST